MKKILLLLAILVMPFPALAQWAPGYGQQPMSAPSHHAPSMRKRPSQPLPQLQPQPMSPPVAEDTIAAVVNDNVITTVDLRQRIRLAILSSGLPDNAEVESHLVPQILRGMIDEQLQAQEAKRLDLSVTPEEINATLAKIAHDNHINGDMRDYITAHGGSADALVEQIRSGLLWNKVIQRELRPQVEVGDDEIDTLVDRIHADAGKEEYLVSEIFLSVDNPKDEQQVKQVADNLVRQLHNGANFSAIARQFSQSAAAAQGGDIGWVQQGQLAPELNRALASSVIDAVSDPIRTTNGFHILGVRDKRTVSLSDASKATVGLMQFFHPYGPADKASLMTEATQVGQAVKSCADANTAVAAYPGWKAQKMGDVPLSKAPQWLADKIRNVPVNGASEPLATDKGAIVLFVCSRNQGGDVDREAIMRSIGTEKLELQSRRLLRDLRRAAYMDIRLGQG